MTEPAPRTMRIEYEVALREYQDGLDEKLRGFRQGPPFLATWVPDPDPVESALGLCEAARDAGMDAIAVAFGPASAEGIDPERLERALAAFGAVTLSRGDGIEVEVRIGRGPRERPAVARASVPRPRRKKRVRESTSARPETHPAHLEAALRAAQAPLHEGALQGSTGVVVRASSGGATLEVAVDADRVVVAAAHRGARSRALAGCLDVVCRILVGRPIQEGADHAVLRAEAALRDPGAGPPARGIVIPERTSGDLDVASRLVRAVMRRYRRKTGYGDVDNRFTPPPAPAWLARPQEDRLREIRDVVAAAAQACGLAAGGADVVQLSGARVRLALADGPGRAVRRRALLAIEVALRRRLEPTLVVELEPRPDASRIRRLV